MCDFAQHGVPHGCISTTRMRRSWKTERNGLKASVSIAIPLLGTKDTIEENVQAGRGVVSPPLFKLLPSHDRNRDSATTSSKGKGQKGSDVSHPPQTSSIHHHKHSPIPCSEPGAVVYSCSSGLQTVLQQPVSATAQGGSCCRCFYWTPFSPSRPHALHNAATHPRALDGGSRLRAVDQSRLPTTENGRNLQ